MKHVFARSLALFTGLSITAISGLAQYTISAKPGAINYVEGTASLNGDQLSAKNLRSVLMNANDLLSTDSGKAEVLLTPGVFLRVGENTEVRMISPSLTDTKVEVLRGEIMVEASGLVKENNLQILDHGASITIAKNGLYRFTADNPPTAAVLDGKADVQYNDRTVDLKKGRETVLASDLAIQKFDTKREDDLYAWSNVRSEYEAASSYRISRSASLNSSSNSFNGGYGYGSPYGFGSGFGPGWLWDSGFNSYAWLPGNGIFYSPFGYGFYSPAYVGYAPVVTTSIYRGGTPWRTVNGKPVAPVTGQAFAAAVPVSTTHPPAFAQAGSASPFAVQQARAQTARAFASANMGNANAGWHGGGGSGAAHASSVGSSHMSGGGLSGGGGHASGGSGGGHGK